MATYNNLPVYKTSYDLLLKVFEAVKKYEKQYKYTLWDKIKTEIVDLISTIYRANSNIKDRYNFIIKAREHTEVLRLYVRLSKDLHLIHLNKFIDLNLDIESLSKQLFAWEKSIKNS